MSIIIAPGPEFAMRYNQSLYPVPEEFKTSGQYYEDLNEDLLQDFKDCCCESGNQAAKAERKLEKFRNILCNIKHFAASVIQKHYLRYKCNRKMKTGNYFKALRHNGVNYSSVLHLLLKQKWENYLQDKTDNILNYTCERVTEKINRQRAAVLIQRNFRRFSAELNYEYMRWVEHLKEQQRNRTVAESIEYYWAGWKQREEAKQRYEREFMKAEDRIEMEAQRNEEEEEDWLVRGYGEMEAYRIEIEAERDAKLEEDMERMREMYFD